MKDSDFFSERQEIQQWRNVRVIGDAVYKAGRNINMSDLSSSGSIIGQKWNNIIKRQREEFVSRRVGQTIEFDTLSQAKIVVALVDALVPYEGSVQGKTGLFALRNSTRPRPSADFPKMERVFNSWVDECCRILDIPEEIKREALKSYVDTVSKAA